MYVIVGLGNPGQKYSKTFHNMGFMVADKLASFLNAKFTSKKCDAAVCLAEYEGIEMVIAKPLTFMNNSGQSVVKLLKTYKAKPENLIVISDDIDLPRGIIRYREKGSAGTHNGLRNIVACLKTQEFKRVRIGIDKPECPLIDYVLSRIDKKTMDVLDPAFDEAVKKIIEIIKQ